MRKNLKEILVSILKKIFFCQVLVAHAYKAEIMRIAVQSQPRQIVREMLP
jgi:hypothetical protein